MNTNTAFIFIGILGFTLAGAVFQRSRPPVDKVTHTMPRASWLATRAEAAASAFKDAVAADNQAPEVLVVGDYACSQCFASLDAELGTNWGGVSLIPIDWQSGLIDELAAAALICSASADRTALLHHVLKRVRTAIRSTGGVERLLRNVGVPRHLTSPCIDSQPTKERISRMQLAIDRLMPTSVPAVYSPAGRRLLP